jgi:TonB family protein
MPIIQIPLHDPEPTEHPPERPAPPASEQLSFEGAFYDARGWEDAYRDLHSAPALLIQVQDDLSRSRMREAFWISVIVHLIAIIVLWNSPRFAKWFPHHQLLVQNGHQQAIPLFLDLPPDAQKVPKPPHTSIQSDKDRMAMSRHPQLDSKKLHDLLGTKPAGTTAPPAPPAAQAQPATPPQAQPPAQNQQQAQRSTPPPPTSNQSAKLQTPPLSPKDVFGGPMSAGSSIEEATRAAASNRGGYGGSGGDYGLGQGRQPTAALGNMDVLSDTMGVDFGGYLSRVLHDVRLNWYNLIPEVARPPIMKKGKVTIEFAITKDGGVSGMTLVGPSGDVSLDRAAWGGITASNPFPPLPTQFPGQYIALRFHFYYNPDTNELQ